MKKIIFTSFVMIVSVLMHAQTVLYHENFELPSSADSVASAGTTGSSSWGISTSYFNSGSRSDTCIITTADTTWLITSSFSTIGIYTVFLEFAQICKIEFFDAAEIEVSNNNGASWTKLTGNEYMGNGQFTANGNKFTSTSYQDWIPSNNNAIPTNAWWKDEKFDLSTLVANSANVKVRFMLRDANLSGAAGNYGWLLDDIRIWSPYLQEVAAVSWSLPYSIPSGCGITQEVINIKIANTGSGIISGNLTAGFQRDGLSPVTETFSTSMNPGDTMTYTFSNLINLTPLVNDTNYNVSVWITLNGDPLQSNDTLTGTVLARLALSDPVINDTTIPYGTSVTLQAYHTQPISWYNDILATNLIGTGSSFTTPVLYDTTVYYVQAGTGAGGTCPSKVKAVTVNISSIPNNDAGVYAVTEPSGLVNSGVSYPVKVYIINSGINTLTKVTVNYSVNGASRPPYIWTGSLLNDSIYGPITIGTDTFTSGVYRIKAWTSMPNDSIDVANHNDTAESIVYLCLAGTFSLGTPLSDFPDIPTFMSILDSVGLCGNTIINIAPGIYNGQILITSISGASNTSQLTLQSATGNPQDVIIQYGASSSSDNYVMMLNGTQFLNVKNISIRASGGTYAYVINLTNGASNNLFEGNIIESAQTTNSNARAIVLYGGSPNQYNTFRNNSIRYGYYGIYCYGVSSSYAKGNVFEGNQVIDYYYMGAYNYYLDSIAYNGNNFVNRSTSSTSYGMYLRYCDGSQITKNRIALQSSSTHYGMYMYYCDSTTTTRGLIANNMISTTGSGTSGHYGIYYNYGNGYDFFYNSLYNENGSTSNYILRIYNSSSSYSGHNIYNNCVFNNGPGYAAYIYNNSYLNGADNNNFYAPNSTSFVYWQGARNDITALKAAFTNTNQHSVSVDPQYAGTNDLHAASLLLNGAGYATSLVNDDFDGELRDSVSPDIGADEYLNFANDAGVSAFVDPYAPCPGDSADVIIKVRNYGYDTLYAVTINWSLNGVQQNTVNISDTIFPLGETQVFLGSRIFLYGINYDMVFWTSLPNGNTDQSMVNDTLIKNGIITSMYPGTYTIGGTGADFATFSDAVNELVLKGVCGPVVFIVASGTYTEQIEIPQIKGTSATNTITFQSAAGDSTSVTLTYAPTSSNNHILWLNGADYITIKHLKFVSTGSTYGICLKLNNNATHNSILNNHFLGINPSSSSSSTYVAALIYATYGTNSWDSCNVYRNNYFNKGYCGIIDNNAGATGEHGLEITDNVFIDHSYIAISLYYLSRPVVSGNYVYQSVPSTYSNNTLFGFYNLRCINGAVYNNNKIYITNASPTSNGMSIKETVGTQTNRIEIYNNFISLQAGTGINCGIKLSGSSAGYSFEKGDVYYNSVNITGSNTNSRSFEMEKGTAGGSLSDIVVMNNIWANNAGGYAIYTDAPSGYTSNHNDFYTSGSNVAYRNSNISTLNNWTIASGQDSMSVSVDPVFFTATDLHTSVFDLNGMAVPISGITNDIDGDPRHPVTPDIGADEFVPSGMDAHLVDIVNPVSGCGLGNDTVSIKIRNASSDTINGNLTAKYTTLNSSTVVSQAVTTTIIPGDTILFSFTTPVNLSVMNDTIFTLISWVELVNDPIQYNDTVYKNIQSGVIPNPPAVSDTTIPYASFAVIPAYSLGTVFWYDSLTGGTLFHIGASYTTPVLYDTVTYYVEARSGSMQSGPFTIGAGTITNTTSSYPAPYGNYYWGAKHQFLIRASELTASGMTAGTISSLGFDVASVAGSALQGFEIKMGQTTANSLTTWYTGTSSVFFQSSCSPTISWNIHNFNTTFNWDGSSNLVVEVCFNNTSSSSNCLFRQTSTSYTSTIAYYGNTSGICMTTATPTASFNQRPNMRFGMGTNIGYCSSIRVPLTVKVSQPPPNDAGVYSVINPGSSVVSGIPIPVTVILKNYGSDTLHTATVNWEVNGILQTPYSWTVGNVPYDQLSPPIVIGNKIFSGGVYTMKLWTSMPNNYPDTSNLNDTIQVSFTACMGGNFTIGGTSADYPTFTAAIADLITYGVCGPVVFNVNNGTYTEQVVIPQLQGTSSTNTVTFQSAAGDSTSVTLTYTPTSSANHVVWLNGADYIIFKHLKMVSVGTTYGIVIKLSNEATHNSILNNYFVGTNPPSGVSSPYNASIIDVSYGNNSYDSCNVFRNNYFYKGYCGVVDNNSGAIGVHGLEITDNIFIDQSYIASSLYYLSRPIITGNKVELHVPSTYTTNNTLHGFYNYKCINGSVIKNNNVYITDASPHCYGVSIRESNGTASNPIEIGNNFFSLESTNGTNVGIKLSSLTLATTVQYAEVYYNSINIVSTGTATNTTTWAFELEQGAGSISNVIMKNNIFANQAGGYAIHMDINQGFETNYNDLYTNGAYLGYNTANRATLSDWITSTGQDSMSVSAHPGYFSATDLHTFQIDLDGAAIPITSYPLDIDGEIRNTLTPDIGADEFDPPQFDAGIVSIDKPHTPADTGMQDVKVTLRNFGTNSLTSVSIYWQVDGINQTPYSWTGVLPTGITDDSISIGTYHFLPGQVSVKAWTSNPNNQNDQFHNNDTAVTTAIVCAGQLNGTYTIGGSNADFSNFTTALDAMSNCGINGPVTFTVAAGTYNEQLSLTPVANASPISKITFMGATGDSTDVILTYGNQNSTANYVVSFNGADYFTFKKMTIASSSGTSYAGVIEMANGANNNEISNCVLESASSNSSYARCIYDYNTLNNYNIYRNNHILNGYYGIYISGASSSSFETGTIIEGNLIEGYYYYGMYLNYLNDLQVESNYIENSTSSGAVYGMRLYYCDNMDVTKNHLNIHGSSTMYGMYVYYCDGNSVKPNLIANNFISMNGSGTGNWYGTYMYGCTYMNYLFNSINNAGAGGTSGRCLYLSSGSNITLLNNILANTGGGYAYYIASPTAIINTDYNDLYATGNYLAYWSGSIGNLTALQSSSGKEVHSISADPVYISASNLHVAGSAVNGQATPLTALVPDDIDGDMRDTITPDMGADEYHPLNYDVGVTVLLEPSTTYNTVGSQNSVKVVLFNYGTMPAYNFGMGFMLPGSAAITETYSDTLAPSLLDTFLFTNTMVPIIGNFEFKIFSSLGNDQNHLNDTISIMFTGVPVLSIPYFEDFESVNYWYRDGVATSWEYGIPSAAVINSAYSPSHAWVTNLNGHYQNNSFDYLYTPKIDLSVYGVDSLRFWHWIDAETPNDGGNLQYLNIMNNWVTLGSQNDTNASNWYNTFSGGQYRWSGQSSGWVLSTYNLNVVNDFGSTTQFRFAFSSNSSNNAYDGWAIDDFELTLPQIPVDAGVISVVTPFDTTVVGSQVQVEIFIKNFGTDTLTNVNLYYSVNNGIVVSETWTGSLLPGSSTNYIFNSKYNPPASVNYSLCAFTHDTYTFNDTTCISLTNVLPLFDAGIINITQPGDFTFFNSDFTVKVMIMNMGQNTLTNIPVTYVTLNSQSASENWTGSLVSGDSVEFAFSQTYNSTLLLGSYSMCAYTHLPGDIYYYDDTLCKVIQNGVGIEEEYMEGIWLGQNVPNPANGNTIIEYYLPSRGEAVFRVFNLVGDVILENRINQKQGKQQILLDAGIIPAGVYYYSLEFKGKRLVRKMVVSR
ncbi:T9SS type A sorting domain-containing protein [Bacteroidota bacterium]